MLFVDSRRQGRALHLAVQRVQPAAAVPRRRARLHDRHRGRAPGDHPPRREDDQRGQRGDRAEALGRSCARPTAPGSTRWPGRRSTPTRASRCRRASIAVMGPQAAVNAVFFNQLQAIEDPDERAKRRPRSCAREYAEDIDILHLASELVVDAVIQPEDLRAELDQALRAAAQQGRATGRRSATRSTRSSTAPRRSGRRRRRGRRRAPIVAGVSSTARSTRRRRRAGSRRAAGARRC